VYGNCGTLQYSNHIAALKQERTRLPFLSLQQYDMGVFIIAKATDGDTLMGIGMVKGAEV